MWNKPSSGWTKLNCDAAVSHLGTNAAAGGVLRGADGHFIFAFSSYLGSCNTSEAELNSILLGASMIVARGLRRVVIESDSLLAIRLIRVGCSTLHPNYGIVRDIHRRIQTIGECSISHVLYEANQMDWPSLACLWVIVADCSSLYLHLFLYYFMQGLHRDCVLYRFLVVLFVLALLGC